MIDYIEKGGNINRQYYTLRQLKKAIKPKYWRKLSADVLLLQDNTPIQKAQTAEPEAANYCFELLTYNSYSLEISFNIL